MARAARRAPCRQTWLLVALRFLALCRAQGGATCLEYDLAAAGRSAPARGADGSCEGVALLQQDARVFSKAYGLSRRQQAQRFSLEGGAHETENLLEVPVADPDDDDEVVADGDIPTTATTTSTLNFSGVTANAVGDLEAFVSALFTNGAVVAACTAIFMVLRVRYPAMYSDNVLKGFAPSSPDCSNHFSWIRASLDATTQDRIHSVGLDSAMLIEFTNFAMKVCVYVGGPIILIEGPMNAIFGGHFSGDDHLSTFSMGNVRPQCWLYWFHAIVIWYVCLVTTHMIFEAQHKFISMRWAWLRGMNETRANTVLVEGIPEEYQSDKKMREFFETIFPGGKIKDAYCVRDTSALTAELQQLASAKKHLFEAEAKKAKDPSNPPVIKWWTGRVEDAVDYYQALVNEHQPKVDALRKEINDASDSEGPRGFYCSAGFITFHNRSDAEIALRLTNISDDQLEWTMDTPPAPSDITWADLIRDPTTQVERALIGYILVGGLYFAYAPLIVAITNIAKILDMGPLQPVWAGIAPTLGLTLMVDFLPTFIILIFQFFFSLKAEAWAQVRLQRWYFWFQLVFVVMAAALGQNVHEFMQVIVKQPLSIFTALAASLPSATHFFLNFLVLQWVSHSMNMMRYIPLSKFKTLSLLYTEDEAKEMAEPEDQDYYGMGSRSARWTICMVICIVYGTLSPPMWILTFLNFAQCRLYYGYLIPFAETKKPDLGGVFWVQMLVHLFHGLLLYSILMTGVLCQRASTLGPMIITAPTIGYLLWARWRFEVHFSWERLPFHELMSDAGKALDKAMTKRSLLGTYRQEELNERQTSC